MYGNHTGGRLFSLIMICLSFALVAVFLTQKVIYPYVGYENVFCIVSASSLISLILLLFFQEKKFIIEEDEHEQETKEYSRLNQQI